MNEIGLFPAFTREVFQCAGILDERSSALFSPFFQRYPLCFRHVLNFLFEEPGTIAGLASPVRFEAEAGSVRLRRRFPLTSPTERIRQE